MSNPTQPPSSDPSPADEALRAGDDAGLSQPTPSVRLVLEKFSIALKRQYFTMGLSLRLGNHLDRSDGVTSYAYALRPDIRQHALIVLRETLEEVSTHRL